MARSKSSISNASTYRQIGEFWDAHDLGEHWDKTRPADFAVDIQAEATYYPIESALSDRIRRIAKKRGVSPETLLNLWLQQRLGKETLSK